MTKRDPVGELNDAYIAKLRSRACRAAKCPLVENNEPYLPSEQEIRQSCHEIRANWSEADRRKRKCGAFQLYETLIPG